ncbi:MAG: glucuronate isomerase [Pseudomonadota bacterium]
MLHPERLLPADPTIRATAKTLYERVSDAPLVCPHGHCDASWFVEDQPFPNATDLLITPDHYVLRMLASQGISYETLGVPRADGSRAEVDPRAVFQFFANNYHLFAGTPSRVWLDHALYEVLGVPTRLKAETADTVFDHVNRQLAKPRFRPRALYQSFGIEVLATTDNATDPLDAHTRLKAQGFGRIVPTFRPDALTDPCRSDFAPSMIALAEQTGEDVTNWAGFLNALKARRAVFLALGATASDHGVESPLTADLPVFECQVLLDKANAGTITSGEAKQFQAQMLTEMAAMSADDGLVMQIHAGSRRNYAPSVFERYGRDKGYDMPGAVAWTEGLKPLLDRFGFEPNLQLVLYTLDETAYGRELAPLAGAFPTVLLGAPWWFFDSPEGMRRYRSQVIETAGFFNTAGFVDDTRAFLSIPARHDVARRMDAGFLACLVAEHQLEIEEAEMLIEALATGLVRNAYKLGEPATEPQRQSA